MSVNPSMLNENLLWARTISPTGRIVKEETFLGALLKTLGFIAALAVLYYVLSLL